MESRWIVVLSTLVYVTAQHHQPPPLPQPPHSHTPPGGAVLEGRNNLLNASRRTDTENFRTINQASTAVTISVNSQTSLYVQASQVATLYFDVVNNNNYNSFYYFYSSATSSSIQSIQPYESWITGYGKVTVKVMIRVSASTTNTETVTFTAVTYTGTGDDPTAIKAYLYIGQQLVSDSSNPGVDYTISGSCRDHSSPSTCGTANWGFQANIKDSDSGLLSVVTVPSGFVFTTDFVAGTKNQVSGRYTASCCLNKVDLIATDLNGNQYKTSIDIYTVWLSAAAIAAIVLACILLLILIIALCCAIVFCVRRRRKMSFTIRSRRDMD